MEVEFVYLVSVSGAEDAAATVSVLTEAAERAVRLNRNFSGYDIDDEGLEEHIRVRLRSNGHDRSAIVRRIVAPIRAVFHRAKIDPRRITLIEQRIMPTKRSLKLDEGRTPPNTFADATLRQMLADDAKL